MNTIVKNCIAILLAFTTTGVTLSAKAKKVSPENTEFFTKLTSTEDILLKRARDVSIAQQEIFNLNEWRTLLTEANEFANTKNVNAAQKFQGRIQAIQTRIQSNLNEKNALKESLDGALKDIAQAIESIEKSRFSARAKRLPYERYQAILMTLEKIFNEKFAEKKS